MASLLRTLCGLFVSWLLVGLAATHVHAAPSGPLGCGGQFGVGGCAPYANVLNSVGNTTLSTYEYDAVDLFVQQDFAPVEALLAGGVHLDTGNLSAFGETGASGRTLTIASATDVFTFTHTSGQPGFAAISALLVANGKGLLGFRGTSASADAFFNTPTLVQLPGSAGGGMQVQAGFTAPVNLLFDYGFAAQVFLNVPLGTPVQIEYALRHVVWDVSQLQTVAKLQFDLPQGVSVTSMSGFQPSPVPEPQSWLLLGAGVALVGGIARRRHGVRAARAG